VTRRVNRGVAWKVYYRMGKSAPGEGRVDFAALNDKQGGGYRIFSRPFDQADKIYELDNGEPAETHQKAARYYLNEFLDDLILRRTGGQYDISMSSYLYRVGCALLFGNRPFKASSQEWERAYRVRHQEHREAMRRARGQGPRQARKKTPSSRRGVRH
jgi:hypothetical protein